MRKIYLLCITAILLTSCGKDEYRCESNTGINTVKSIYKDALMNSRKVNNSGADEKFIDDFLDNKLTFSMIRTSNLNEEIKKCECEAKVIFNVERDFSENQLADNWIWNNASQQERLFLKTPIKNELLNGIDIVYTLQETANEEIIAETYEIEKLKDIIVKYFEYSKSKEQPPYFKPDSPERDKVFTYVSGTEDCSYEIWFILSPRDNKVKGSYTQDCIGDNGAGKKKITGTFENGIIYGNIEGEEFFEIDFKGSDMNYYLRKIVRDDNSEIKFDRENPLIFSLKQ